MGNDIAALIRINAGKTEMLRLQALELKQLAAQVAALKATNARLTKWLEDVAQTSQSLADKPEMVA